MENRELYTHIFQYDGNACVCIGPEEHGIYANFVPVYDLDSSDILQLSTHDVMNAVQLRRTEECDFQWDAILNSRYCDEAMEICYELFD
jgi:hypothetical protein